MSYSNENPLNRPITQEDRDYIRFRDPIAAVVLESMIREKQIRVLP